jgi:hypothetical protein
MAGTMDEPDGILNWRGYIVTLNPGNQPKVQMNATDLYDTAEQAAEAAVLLTPLPQHTFVQWLVVKEK